MNREEQNTELQKNLNVDIDCRTKEEWRLSLDEKSLFSFLEVIKFFKLLKKYSQLALVKALDKVGFLYGEIKFPPRNRTKMHVVFGAKMWNTLPTELKSTNNLDTFKHMLKKVSSPKT